VVNTYHTKEINYHHSKTTFSSTLFMQKTYDIDCHYVNYKRGSQLSISNFKYFFPFQSPMVERSRLGGQRAQTLVSAAPEMWFYEPRVCKCTPQRLLPDACSVVQWHSLLRGIASSGTDTTQNKIRHILAQGPFYRNSTALGIGVRLETGYVCHRCTVQFVKSLQIYVKCASQPCDIIR